MDRKLSGECLVEADAQMEGVRRDSLASFSETMTNVATTAMIVTSSAHQEGIGGSSGDT